MFDRIRIIPYTLRKTRLSYVPLHAGGRMYIYIYIYIAGNKKKRYHSVPLMNAIYADQIQKLW